jgi:hypothetical protein
VTKVINFFAGPGAGKSTAAAGLFFEMKCLGLNVELVTEYAKELCYQGKLGSPVIANAWRMHNKQCGRQELLRGKVDFIVTDSPLIKDVAYCHYTLKTQSERVDFENAAMANFDSWENYNVWVLRAKPYQAYGRRESEESARSVDDKLRAQFEHRMHIWLHGDRRAPTSVLEELRLKGWC